MAETNRQSFEVVRRGYDIDQVDQFLVHQAGAWRAELFEAQRKIAALEADLSNLSQLEAELEQAHQQQEALTLTLQSAAQAKDRLLANAEKDAEELRSRTEQDAEELRTTTEKDAEELRTTSQNDAEELRLKTEEELETLRSEASEEAESIVTEAKDKAASLVESAEQEANDSRHRARMRTDELMLAQEEQLQQRRAELDEEFETAVSRYELVERSLKDKVTELNSMREALVTGLEAIATGGLSALEDVEDELAAVGIARGDDSAGRQLVGGVKPEPFLPEETEKSA